MAEGEGNGAAAFVAAAQAMAEDGRETVSDAELERVLSAAVKLYARRAEATGTFPAPVSAQEVTATEVLVVVSEMIRTVDLNLFDLSMWHGRSRPGR